jgi:two-component sensor histidine kinase
MAIVEGESHIVRYLNPAFCRLIDRTKDELLGKPFRDIMLDEAECLASMGRVYRTAKSFSFTAQEDPHRRLGFNAYTIWPVMADERVAGVALQVAETAPFYEKTVEMNEALMVASMRQHALTATADAANIKLQQDIVDREQRERDAQMFTNEIAHRIKNNLQIVMSLIDFETRSTAAPCVQGYEAMRARIGAISELYDLMSQSGHGRMIDINKYLAEIVEAMSASLLGGGSGIEIANDAEALEIDTDRAVLLGLLVNELVTNAVKHGFPGGTGRVVVGVKQRDDQIELSVADNGVGMRDNKISAHVQGQHGADYVAIFVRQLAATIAVSGSEATGTIVSVSFPCAWTPPQR